MAPEQMEKPLSVDHRADIYSLGVVFYELLTGELPIGRFAPPSEKTNVSADLDQVVLRTLEKEPNRRYQQASEVKTAVESLSGEQGYAGRAAAIAPHTQRLHVPFTFDDVYGGWARADGILRFDGRELTLEFQVKDNVVGYMTSGVKTVSVPLADVISLKLVSGWLGWNPMLELRTDKLLTLRDIPGRAGGVVRLAIARSDVELARQVAEAVNAAIAPAVPAVALAARTAKPPLPGEGIRWQKIAHDVHGPATGLMIVGILDCVTMLLLFMVIPVFTALASQRSSAEPSGASNRVDIRFRSCCDHGWRARAQFRRRTVGTESIGRVRVDDSDHRARASHIRRRRDPRRSPHDAPKFLRSWSCCCRSGHCARTSLVRDRTPDWNLGLDCPAARGDS